MSSLLRTLRLSAPAVFLLALTIRIGYCAWTHRGPYPFQHHYREYIVAGQRLLENNAFLSPLMSDGAPAEVSGLMPPLYTLWVAGVYGLFGVESTTSIWTIELANAAALSLACMFVFLIAGALAGSRAAWIASMFATFNPALIGYANYVWDTSFFALAVTLSVWFSIQLRTRSPRIVEYLLFGGWLGFVALLNPALTPAYPLLVLFPLWQGRQKTPAPAVFCGVLFAVLGWMITLTPWTIRNYVQLGKLHYVRSGLMLEVWMGVVPEADHAGGSVYRTHFPLNNPEMARHVAEIGENKYLAECGERARRAIAEDPVRFRKLVGMRTIDYGFGTVLTHATPQHKFVPATLKRKVIMLVFTVETLLILVGLTSGRLRTVAGWWLVSILLVFSLIYCITHVQVRFRVPVEAIAAILMGLVFPSRDAIASTRRTLSA